MNKRIYNGEFDKQLKDLVNQYVAVKLRSSMMNGLIASKRLELENERKELKKSAFTLSRKIRIYIQGKW